MSGMTRHQLLKFELVVRIEPAAGTRYFLAQQSIGADNAAVVGSGKPAIEHEKMIANGIKPVGIALVERMRRVSSRSKLRIKDPEADFLRRGDFGFRTGKTDFERTYSSQNAAFHDGIILAADPEGSRAIVTLGQSCVHERFSFEPLARG
jgi:hypothetical protein